MSRSPNIIPTAELPAVPAPAGPPQFLAPLGRILFSLIFVLSGFHHFSKATIDYAAQQGLPMAEVLVPVSGVMAIVGGLSILLGFYARVGAWILVLFLVPVTLKMHAFWEVIDPQMRQMQMINFMKNVSMLGGSFLLAWFGPGPLSIDARRR